MYKLCIYWHTLIPEKEKTGQDNIQTYSSSPHASTFPQEKPFSTNTNNTGEIRDEFLINNVGSVMWICMLNVKLFISSNTEALVNKCKHHFEAILEAQVYHDEIIAKYCM